MRTEIDYLLNVTLPEKLKSTVDYSKIDTPVKSTQISTIVDSVKDKYPKNKWLTLGVQNSNIEQQIPEYLKFEDNYSHLRKYFGISFISIPADPVLIKHITDISDSVFDPYRDDYFLPSGTEILETPGAQDKWSYKNYSPELIDAISMINLPDNVRDIPSSELSVGIIDSGLDTDHPAFQGLFEAGDNYRNFCKSDIDQHYEYLDGVGHGTHCASIFFGSRWKGQNGQLLGGVITNPEVKKYAAKVFSYNGGGTSTIDILDALAWTVFEKHVDVVSMSLGGGLPDGTSVLTKAINKCIEQNSFFTVSAGNSTTPNSPHSNITAPGDSNGLTVGAICKDFSLCPFSSKGDPTGKIYPAIASKPDIVLPGGSIVAAYSKDALENRIKDSPLKEVAFSGTSMSTPVAAGIAGLIISAQKQNNSSYTPDDIKNVIKNISSNDVLAGEYSKYEVGSGLPDISKIFTKDTTMDETFVQNDSPATLPIDKPGSAKITILDYDQIKEGFNGNIGTILYDLAVYKKMMGGMNYVYVGINKNSLDAFLAKSDSKLRWSDFLINNNLEFDFNKLSHIISGNHFNKLPKEVKRAYRVPYRYPSKSMPLKEVLDLANFKHPNIIKIHDAILDKESSTIVTVLEYADGTLDQFENKKYDAKISKDVLYVKMFQDLYEGLNHLHNNDAFAGDISLKNIFYFCDEDKIQFKLGDLLPKKALQKIVIDSGGKGFYNDMRIMAPDEFSHQSFSSATDVYRLSTIFYFWVTGNYPISKIEYNYRFELEKKFFEEKFNDSEYINDDINLEEYKSELLDWINNYILENITPAKIEYYNKILNLNSGKNKIPFYSKIKKEHKTILADLFLQALNPDEKHRADSETIITLLNKIFPQEKQDKSTDTKQDKDKNGTNLEIGSVGDIVLEFKD